MSKSRNLDIGTDIRDDQSEIKKPVPVISDDNQGDIKDRYIVTLENQVRTKDEQIEKKDEQIKELQQSAKTRDQLVIALNNQLLRLLPGKPESEPETEPQDAGISYEPVDEHHRDHAAH
jgi:thymidylate synthase